MDDLCSIVANRRLSITQCRRWTMPLRPVHRPPAHVSSLVRFPVQVPSVRDATCWRDLRKHFAAPWLFALASEYPQITAVRCYCFNWESVINFHWLRNLGFISRNRFSIAINLFGFNISFVIRCVMPGVAYVCGMLEGLMGIRRCWWLYVVYKCV